MGTKVFSLGFPPATIRSQQKKGSHDTDGTSQYLTSGEVVSSQDSCFMDVDPDSPLKSMTPRGTRKFSNPDRTKNISDEVKSGNLYQTTLDLLPGMSGGGLLDSTTGEIYGVAQFSLDNSRMSHCKGDGFYSSMTSILSDLRQNFPDVVADGSLHCEKHALFPKSNGESEVEQQKHKPLDDEGIR